MKPRKPIKRSALKRKPRRPKPGDEPDYLAWIRTLPCVICWGFPGVYEPLGTCQPFWEYELKHKQPTQLSRTEAAHYGARGLSQKARDCRAIPLCSWEHHREGPLSHHKLGRRFAEKHGLDVELLIETLNRKYDEEIGCSQLSLS